MIAWSKTLHIVALMIWCAGLLILPIVYAQRAGLRGEALHELHRFARAVFIHIASPAAFVAVIAGSLLIFLRDVFTVWMALKLLAVGALVVIHVRQGYIILHLFEPGHRYARWRQYVALTATTATIVTILALVLAKPTIELELLPEVLFRPGGLQSLLDTIIPIP